MKTTSQQVRDSLKLLWPELEFVWLKDTTFWRGRKGELDRLIENSKLVEIDFVPEFADCDDFAREFLSEVWRKRYFSWKSGNIPDEQRFPWALFIVDGTQFRGVQRIHTCNLVWLLDDWYFVDMTPQERRAWKADPQQDTIYHLASN